jgi:hypothetical protein
MAVRAHDVTFPHQILGLGPVDAGKADIKRNRQAEAFLVVALADADVRCDFWHRR